MQMTKRYLFPPRPAKDPVPYTQIDMFKGYGWVAQTKYNDHRLLISLDANGVEIFNRHREHPRAYVLPDDLRAEIVAVCHGLLGLSREQWSYLDGGLLHNKSRWLANTIAIWDILVREGDFLLGTTYSSRYNWLLSKVQKDEPFLVTVGSQQFDFGIKLSDHIFLPRLWESYSEAWEFTQRVNAAAGWKGPGDGEPVVEGVILKDPQGILSVPTREDNNTTWSTRCRVRTGRHRM